jgi:hypothetical protein
MSCVGRQGSKMASPQPAGRVPSPLGAGLLMGVAAAGLALGVTAAPPAAGWILGDGWATSETPAR